MFQKAWILGLIDCVIAKLISSSSSTDDMATVPGFDILAKLDVGASNTSFFPRAYFADTDEATERLQMRERELQKAVGRWVGATNVE